MRSRHVMSGVGLLLVAGLVAPTTASAGSGLKPLSSVPVPLPPNLCEFVADVPAAVRLGKALFWDMQVGGDGVQACASCHFHAGVDIRTTNTVNPGDDRLFATSRPGLTLTAKDFPVTTGDVVGSQGVTGGNFVGVSGGPTDVFLPVADPLFNLNGVNQRRVTERNSPSIINAIFYQRTPWDGRAGTTFNGVDAFGPTAQTASVYRVTGGAAVAVQVSIPNASLASQALSPPNNPVEMAFAGRRFSDLGAKMLGLTPLAQQEVDPGDSVLGRLAAAPRGLKTSYVAMIQAAFDPRWWRYDGPVIGKIGILESNFSLYFGLSIMLYASTLVSDQTPFDDYLRGNDNALTESQKQGLNVFAGPGKCAQCHKGAELSEASVSQAGHDPTKGFVNTALRPIAEDVGDVLQPGQGKFKTPQLRNVELTGPYFHDGSASTLWQVLNVYDRGGNFRTNFTDENIKPLGLSNADKGALVDFMVAMTDERVRFERAPFDHPSLDLPNGERVPAVGAAGRVFPLQTFLGLDPNSH